MYDNLIFLSLRFCPKFCFQILRWNFGFSKQKSVCTFPSTLVIPLSIEKNIHNVLTLYLGRLVTFLGNACKGTRYLVGLEMNEIGT